MTGNHSLCCVMHNHFDKHRLKGLEALKAGMCFSALNLPEQVEEMRLFSYWKKYDYLQQADDNTLLRARDYYLASAVC